MGGRPAHARRPSLVGRRIDLTENRPRVSTAVAPRREKVSDFIAKFLFLEALTIKIRISSRISESALRDHGGTSASTSTKGRGHLATEREGVGFLYKISLLGTF